MTDNSNSSMKLNNLKKIATLISALFSMIVFILTAILVFQSPAGFHQPTWLIFQGSIVVILPIVTFYLTYVKVISLGK